MNFKMPVPSFEVPDFIKSIRYMLLFVNVIAVLTGTLLLITGIVVLIIYREYDAFITRTFFTIPSFVIATGAILLLASALGFYGAFSEHFYCIAAYVIIFLVLLVFDIAMVIVAYGLESSAASQITSTMWESFQLYGTRWEISMQWDELHKEFECCGVTGPFNWISNQIPISCCHIDYGVVGTFECRAGNTYTVGCASVLSERLGYNAHVVAVTALVATCLQGKHTSNLKNHLAVKHVDIYNEVMNLNKELNRTKDKHSTNQQQQLTTKVKNICMQLVAVYGHPLALLNHEPFQNLLQLLAPSSGCLREINEKSVRAMIPQVAYDLKLKIAAELRHKLVSLKIDSATCQERRFLGVNVQYIKNARIVIRNLTVIEVNESQTGEFLKEKVEEVLKDCMIHKKQVYSSTTDNGANMKKMVKCMGGNYNSEYFTLTNDDIVNTESESEDEDEENHEQVDRDSAEAQLVTLQNMFNENDLPSDFKMRGLLCAAHTLQLAIKDAIAENIEVQAVFDIARKVSKILRTPSNRNLLKLANLKIPIVDCSTRWTSKYNMIKRLLELKEICPNITNVSQLVSQAFWSEIEQLIICLEPFNKSTLLLQNEQLTIGDFFINWMECKSRVGAIHHPFAESLQRAMESRESSLLETDAVLEGLYLDGRLNIVLSDDQCQKAKALLNQTWRRLKNVMDISDDASLESSSSNIDLELQHHNTQHDDEQAGPSNREENLDAAGLGNQPRNDLTIVEQMLMRTEMVRSLPSIRMSSFDVVLNELRNSPRLSLDTNILQHWHNKAIINADIAMVANTVLASPVTQVSVERMFSSLKFLFSPLRSNLNSNLLRDMLFIRSNKDLLE